MSEPYVTITPAGLNALATNYEINQILSDTYKIFRQGTDITLPVFEYIRYEGGGIYCTLVTGELGKIIKAVYDLFTSESITLPVDVTIKYDGTNIVCEIIEPETEPESEP